MRIALITILCSTTALAGPGLEFRTGFIECGRSQIRARAECYDATAYCTTETLSFTRSGGRAIVPVHPERSNYEVAGAKLQALEYRASSWACVPGRTGGHYLVVVMSRPNGAACRDCEYSRLYDLNGRVVSTDLDERGRDLMRKVLGGPGPHVFSDVYR